MQDEAQETREQTEAKVNKTMMALAAHIQQYLYTNFERPMHFIIGMCPDGNVDYGVAITGNCQDEVALRISEKIAEDCKELLAKEINDDKS